MKYNALEGETLLVPIMTSGYRFGAVLANRLRRNKKPFEFMFVGYHEGGNVSENNNIYIDGSSSSEDPGYM